MDAVLRNYDAVLLMMGTSLMADHWGMIGILISNTVSTCG